MQLPIGRQKLRAFTIFQRPLCQYGCTERHLSSNPVNQFNETCCIRKLRSSASIVNYFKCKICLKMIFPQSLEKKSLGIRVENPSWATVFSVFSTLTSQRKIMAKQKLRNSGYFGRSYPEFRTEILQGSNLYIIIRLPPFRSTWSRARIPYENQTNYNIVTTLYIYNDNEQWTMTMEN